MKHPKRLLSVLVILLCVLILTACGKPLPADCSEHTGKSTCTTCGLNYHAELTKIIRSKAPDNTEYSVTASTDNVDCKIQYNEEDDRVLVSLVYKTIMEKPVVFLMTIAPSTGSVYGWAMSYDGQIANGTFDAEQVDDIIFEPTIENNELSTELFTELDAVYKESVSFCADALHALIADSTNNLTIKDLGFLNYKPGQADASVS